MKKYLLGVLALCGLVSQLVLAEAFSPGQEGVGVGKKTLLESIRQVSPGKAVFTVVDINAVYLNTLPANVKAHYTADDVSGKGKVYVADVASNPALANAQLCWRGVGSDWDTTACGPISNGRAEVTIDVGQTRSQTFTLVPVLMEGEKQITLAAHPENTRVQLTCPGMEHSDTASVFTVDADGKFHIAREIVGAVADYETHYGTFCQR